MKTNARRMISWVAAITLLLTCVISGLVLPVAAESDTTNSGDEGSTTSSAIIDEDFESGAKGPFTNATDITKGYWGIVDGGYGGGKALKIAYKSGDRWLQMSGITFEANTRYAITFLAKGEEVRFGEYQYTDTTGAEKNTSMRDVKGDSFNVYTQPYADDWTSYRLEFTAGANGYVPDAGYGWMFNRSAALAEDKYTLIDNFKVEKIDETVERIVGGDFTAPGMQQWNTLLNTGGFSIVADPADSTNKVLKMDSGKIEAWLKNLYLEAGRTYTISFKSKGATFGFYTPTKNVIGSDTLTPGGWTNIAASDDWTSHTLEFTCTTGGAAYAEAAWILDIGRGDTVDGVTYIDDFSIIEKEIPAATAITLNKTSAVLGVNATEQLTVTTTPAGARYDSLTWSSGAESVATVDATGKVTAVALGTATITATLKVDGTTLTATCTVKVANKPSSFSIVQDSLHLAPAIDSGRKSVYETIELITTPADADITALTWTSSNIDAVTVDENGKVTAKAAGTSTVTVTDGVNSDSITVTVDALGERITGGDFEGTDWNVTYWTNGIIKEGNGSIVEDPDNSSNHVLMIPGEKQAMWMWPLHVDYGVTYKLTMKVKSSLSKPTVAHITSGHVEGISEKGWIAKEVTANEWTEVSIIIRPGTSNPNRNYVFGFGTNIDTTPLYIDDVSLVQVADATSIALEDTNIGVRGEKTLVPTLTPTVSNLGKLTWTSSDSNVITVDQNGKIKAVGGEGSATITATTEDGSLTASCVVTISGDYATAIKLNKETHYAKKNSHLELVMSTTPVDGMYKTPVWTSSNTAIATVDQNGAVTVLDQVGETTITVTCGSLTASCKVIVPGAAESFEIADKNVKLAPKQSSRTVSKTLNITTTPPNADPGTLTWTSSNTDVATVDENGKVTALAEGTTTITATGTTGSSSVTVTVDWSGERVTGGDFENGDYNAAPWTGSIIRDNKGYVIADPANEDNMVLAMPNNGKLDALWMAPLMVEANKTYKLTMKVKGDGVNTAELAVHFTGSYSNLNGWKYVSKLDGEWREVSYTFTIKSGVNINYVLGICNNKDAIVYIDDVSLVQLPNATKLVFESEEVSVRPEGSMSLNLKTEPAEAGAGLLTWTSSDDTIVSVDAEGKVSAVANSGFATITVTNQDGLSASIKVSVSDYAELLENGDFEMGDTNWPSHANIKAGIGKDGSTGLLLDFGAKKTDVFYKGTLPLQPSTTYVVEWDYKASEEAEFRLWAGNIGMTSYGNTKKVGEWVHASTVFTTPATMVDINDAQYKGWIFAVVSDAQGTGTGTIVDNISLKLYSSGVEAESIKMNKSTLTMMPGRTDNLAIMATPADGDVNRAVWTSSNTDVATVEYGVVTAVGKGTATITATTYDNRLSATCTVTVAGEPAFIKNGTFDQENPNTSWTLNGVTVGNKVGVATGTTVDGKQVTQNSNAAVLSEPVADNMTQKLTGTLKPNTEYQIFVRHRAASSGNLNVTLYGDSYTEENYLFNKEVSASGSWTKETFTFKTGDTVADDVYLTIFKTDGTGDIYVDNVFIAEKASMIDLVVTNVSWVGGDEQVTPGTKLTFMVMIENQGDDPVKAGSVIDTDICIDGKTIQTISYPVTSEFGSGSNALVFGTEEWAAVEGDHVVSARVNSTMSILEFDPTNNNRFQTDLRVNDVILEIPEIAANAGFDTLGFSDDFNTLDTIDSGDTRADGYKWYVSRPYGTKSVTADGYSIENGILTLKDSNPVYNMSLTTAEYNSGIGFTYNQGYMEVRIRIPRPRENAEGESGIPAIWSLPINKLQGYENVNWVEMDWLEYWGDNYYTITLHDQDAVDGSVGGGYYNKNSNYSQQGLNDGEWHTMAWLWVQNAVVGYLDGEEVFRLTYSEDDFSNPTQTVVSPGDRGGIGAFSYMNEQYLPVHISGSKDNPMEMDYIRIWTGTGGGTLEPTPGDDDDDTPIDVEPEDFWYDYCTDDYGDPIMTVDEENYLNILAGQEIWNRLTDERRAEINALLESLGMPSFDELLAAALRIANGGESPDTGEHATALPAMAAVLMLSVAGLWVSRKRKKTQA